jgi:hypothetical protein
VTCVLSPSSANAIMPNEAMRGSKSMPERFLNWLLRLPPNTRTCEVKNVKYVCGLQKSLKCSD